MEDCNCVHASIGAVTAGLISGDHNRTVIAIELMKAAALLCIQMREENDKLKGGKKAFKRIAEDIYLSVQEYLEE